MSERPSSPSAPARRGRRSGATETRGAILEAARARFAKDGFAATTIRKIAADADVDGSLVIQFFRSKEELFAAVLSISSDALDKMANAFDGPAEHVGERVARAFLTVWEAPSRDSDSLLAMLRAVVSSEVRSTEMREFIQQRLVATISPKIKNHPDDAIRAGLVASMLVGIIIGRCIVHVPALSEREAVIRLIGPALQTILQ